MENLERTRNFVSAPLFVYGTLRKGFRSHGILRRLHARFLTTGHICGRLYDLGEYPGAVESARGAERIHGEVYLLPNPERAFKVLDKFEGFDPAKAAFNLFERKRATVSLIGGGQLQAWTYWLPSARRSGRRVPSGNYGMRRVSAPEHLNLFGDQE